MPSNPYILNISDTISTAWQKVKGTKGSVWGALGILILVSIGFAALGAGAKAILPHLEPVVRFIGQVIIGLLQIGILYIGIKRAFDLPFTWDMMFRTFNFSIALKVIGVYILQTLIFIPGMIIFALGIILIHQLILTILICFLGIALTIYLAMRLFPAMGFVLDKEVGPLDAVSLSFTATRGNFWQLLVLIIFQSVVIFLSIIPLLGIGLIWSIPFCVILFGEIYKSLLVNTTTV